MDTDYLPWMDDAACATTDPEFWFPDQGGEVIAALRVCATCMVVKQCRAYALDEGIRYGTWGGMSQNELRRRGAEVRRTDVRI